jgi:hypothetical protein
MRKLPLAMWLSVESMLLGGACQFPAPQPPPNLALITNSLEWFSEEDVRTSFESHTPDLFTATAVPFRSSAAIDLNWIMANPGLLCQRVRDPGGACTWPPTSQVQEYTDYARANRNTDRAFGVFFVAHMADNPSSIPSRTCPGLVAGVTSILVAPANEVVPDAASRFSFMFLTDIDRVMLECERMGMPAGWSRHNYLVSVVAHELGHQRAGLTHSNEQPQYHRGTYGAVPSQQYDVMITGISNDQRGRFRYSAFDRLDQYPQANDGTSCQGNLFRWRSITN